MLRGMMAKGEVELSQDGRVNVIHNAHELSGEFEEQQ